MELTFIQNNRSYQVDLDSMIGRKIGIGGSIGFKYLNETAEKHRIFSDVGELTTFLIPRSALPKLPQDVEDNLGFYFHVKDK